MVNTTAFIIVALIALASPEPVRAHSVDELQSLLREREKHFEAVDRTVPVLPLADSEGRALTLAAFRGEVLVVQLLFGASSEASRLQAERLATVQALVNHTPMKEQVRFISIALGPASENSQALKAFGSRHGLDPANWVLLRTPFEAPAETARVANRIFGHGAASSKDDNLPTSLLTHVIDKEGRWRANFRGLEFEPVNVVVYVNALTNDPQRPHGHGQKGWWDRAWAWLGSLMN